MVTAKLLDDMIRAEASLARFAAGSFSDGVIIEARSVVADDELDLDSEITEDNFDDITGLLSGAADDFDAEAGSEEDTPEEDTPEETPEESPEEDPESDSGENLEDLEGLEGLEDVPEESEEVDDSTNALDVVSRAVDMVLEILRHPSAKTASAIEDLVIATELVADAMPEWVKNMSPEAKRNFCDRSPNSKYCGGGGESKPKPDAGKKNAPKEKVEKKEAPAEKVEKEEALAEKPKATSVDHPKDLGDGPFEFESRSEKPMSGKSYDDMMGGAGVAMILPSLRKDFAAAGKGDLFDKRIEKGVLTEGDVEAIKKAVMDASADNGKYDGSAALKAVTNYLFKSTGGNKEQKPDDKAPIDKPVDKKEPEKKSPEDKPEKKEKPEEKAPEEKAPEKKEPAEDKTEKAPEKKEDKKSPDEGQYGLAISQGKHHLIDSPLDLKDTEGLSSKGFKEPKPGNHKLTDNSVVVDPKSGEKFKFGDLPPETQDKIRKVVESKGAWIAPKQKKETKKDAPADAPKDDKAPAKGSEHKDTITNSLKDVGKGLKGLGKSLAKGFASLLGKGAGKGSKAIGSLIKKKLKSDGPLRKKYVGTKKTVRDLISDLWSEAAAGYSAGKGATASLRFAVEDEIVASIIADRIAARGMQTQRKDKDLMSDTGGSSKGRQRQPWVKPPRDDLKNRLSPKRKTPDQKDNDNDKGKDKSAQKKDEGEEAMTLM